MHGCQKKTTYHIYNDGVDVSSGVENDNGIGKSREKIKQFGEVARM